MKNQMKINQLEIHRSLLLYLENLELHEDYFIVGYFDKIDLYTFVIIKPNRRFLINKKNVVSQGLKFKSKKVVLFKYSDTLNYDILEKYTKTIKSLDVQLEYFEICLAGIYVFNSESLREVFLKNF